MGALRYTPQKFASNNSPKEKGIKGSTQSNCKKINGFSLKKIK